MSLIIAGVLGLVASAVLTQSFLRNSGRSVDSFPSSAGKGIVPSWVSLINLGSWVLIAVGLFRAFIG
jgi:hypothetical protein